MHAFMGGGFQEKPVNMPGDAGCARAADSATINGWISDSMPAKYRAAGFNRPRVLYDNVKIGQLGAEHFIERGFKHVALLNGGNAHLVE